MDQLIACIMSLRGDDILADEAAACDAVVAARYPDGIRCPVCGGVCVERKDAHVTCRNTSVVHRFTILEGTALGSKRQPRLLLVLLALRALCLTTRGIPARELARITRVPISTAWRHLQTLRALLPSPPQPASTTAAAVHVCGAAGGADEAWVRIEGRSAMHVIERAPDLATAAPGDVDRPRGEALRDWIDETFCRVSAAWLHRYLHEAAARWVHGDRDALLRKAAARACVERGPAQWFVKRVRPRDFVERGVHPDRVAGPADAPRAEAA